MNSAKKSEFYRYKTYTFSEIFESAFEIYKKIFPSAGLIVFLFAVIQIVVSSSIQILFFGISIFSQDIENFDYQSTSLLAQFGATFSSALLAGLTSPMIASIFLLCKNYLETNEQPKLNVFEYYNPPYFKKIFLFGFSYTLLNELIILLFRQLDIEIYAFLPIALISLFTTFVIPMIVLRDLDISKSMTLSFDIVKNQPLNLILLLIVSSLFSILGIFALCVGIFFTVPLIYIVIFSVYNHQFPIQKTHEIDEIGNE